MCFTAFANRTYTENTVEEVCNSPDYAQEPVVAAAEAQKQLHDALNFEGSDEEKKVRMYLNALGIDYDYLSKEELVTQINILKNQNI